MKLGTVERVYLLLLLKKAELNKKARQVLWNSYFHVFFAFLPEMIKHQYVESKLASWFAILVLNCKTGICCLFFICFMDFLEHFSQVTITEIRYCFALAS